MFFDLFNIFKNGLFKNANNRCIGNGSSSLQNNNYEMMYDFSTVEGIARIPIPTYNKVNSLSTPCYNLEYFLNRKATELKNTNPNLAIACLRKANEIYPYSNFGWSEKDYMRVVEFLKYYGRYDEARAEKEFIENQYLKTKSNSSKILNNIDSDVNPYKGSDLLESTDTSFVCEECAKYTKRIFSENGENPKYPKLPEYFKKNLEEHKYCSISFYPVLENISIPAWEYSGDLVSFCNRPFVDERTPEQKRHFEDEVRRMRIKEFAKDEYDWLREFLPDVAPKSLSGYSRMKNIQSENYLKIKQAAKEKGKELIDI